jgi:AraC-like DNA-binding protein
MFPENKALAESNLTFPASLPEPPSYYSGLSAPQRPRSDNLIVFLRNNRAALQQKNFANRSHHRHVLILVLQTAGSIIVDGMEHRLSEGSAFYIKPFQFHHYLNLNRDELRWLFITFDLSDGAQILAPLSHLSIKIGATERTLWQDLVDRTQAFDTKERYEALPIMDRLLQRIVRTHDSTSPEKTTHSWIARVEGLIIQSVEEGWSVDLIGKKIGMSGRHLRALFEREMGINIRDYRANYQLHRALSLMHDPKLPLGRIAELSGFNSQAVFNRFIKRKTGKTPKDLRQSVGYENASLVPEASTISA